MFAFAAFVVAAVGQEFWRGVRARRAMARESVPVALVALVRRNRRRYGGYLVHVGIAVLFVGVAASSAFQAPGARLAAARPDAARRRLRDHLRQADVAARRRAQRAARADRPRRRPARAARRRPAADRCTPTSPTSRRPIPSLGPVSRFFEGEATSEVGLRAGLRRDLWTAVAPDIGRLRPVIDAGRQGLRARTALRPSSGRVPRPGAARAQPLLHAQPAAGHVPHHRLAARDLDLARRADRVPRRGDRALARRRAAPAARPPRPGLARVARELEPRVAAWSSCWSSSCSRSPCWCSRAAARAARARARRGARERAELEAARDAKYAEIRDAELDYRTGKLSEADWRALDRQLRGRGGRAAAPARREPAPSTLSGRCTRSSRSCRSSSP